MAPRVGIYVRDTFTAIRRNGMIAFAAISTSFIALFLLGFALLLRQEVNLLVAQTEANVEVSVYLDDSISQSQPTIFHNQPELTQNVSADALPASFRVKLKDPKQFNTVSVRLQGQPGIAKIV